jgi:ketol-acid reductoisomerase
MKTPFPVETLHLTSGPDEQVIRGGRIAFPLVREGLEGVKQVAIIGWGSQGPAQAQNFRDTLREIGSDIKVVVGLREESKSIDSAIQAGFNAEDETLLEMYHAVSSSELVIVLISDGAMTENYKEIFEFMKPGATLGLSHGFLEGHLSSIDESFREDINVVMVAPKGMGPSVRNLYLQGKTQGGSGINCSVAIHQDVTGTAEAIAHSWAVAIGSPVTFQTTIPMEWRSDLFGERAILLGGVHGMVQALYDMYAKDFFPKAAFEFSVLALTTFISPKISELGLRGFYEQYIADNESNKSFFDDGYNSSYPAFEKVMTEIYSEVSSGREIQEVIAKTADLKDNPMSKIGDEPMWIIGQEIPSDAQFDNLEQLSAFTAGVFIAGVMAQFDLLLSKGHCVSEIVNESLIEATDSLIPFMRARGISWMVDNCSTTARLGSRKWAPRFYEELDAAFGSGKKVHRMWLDHTIHQDVKACYLYKPEVAIAVA